MHVHTTRGSSDSNLSPEEMVLESERLGFMGICITEHSGPWDQHEFRSFAAKHNQVLVRAMEVETNMGHILAFGLDSYQPGISDSRVLRKAATNAGGFIISAHPFRGLYSSLPSRRPLLYSGESNVPSTAEEASLHPVFGLVDAVEVANGGTADVENRFALDVAKELGLKVTGGSDAHSQHGVGHCITVFDGEVNNQEEFINALREGSFYPAVLSPNNKSPEGSWVPIPEPFS
jgi:predicted metal-dependent phosphoesterase TrpH